MDNLFKNLTENELMAVDGGFILETFVLAASLAYVTYVYVKTSKKKK